MSCNYYWRVPEIVLPTGETLPIDRSDPRVHLGNHVIGGFIWAQDPVRAWSACKARPDEEIVEAEDGALLTGAAFLDLMGGLVWHVHALGREFS